MTKPVVNVEEVEFRPRSTTVPNAAADRFEATFARVGLLVGAKQLGYDIAAVPPGKSAFPYHSHRVNEEMFFVLRGAGSFAIAAALAAAAESYRRLQKRRGKDILSGQLR